MMMSPANICCKSAVNRIRYQKRFDPMPILTDTQIVNFLTSPRHAIVATIKKDGTPQLSPVWYIYEDGVVYISVVTKTAKYHNLKRDPRLSICIDAGLGDFRTVTLSGTAELIEPGTPRQDELRRRIIGHYQPDEASARRYYESVKVNPAAIIVLKPQQMITNGFN
jgi:PPOX class probable F420-dependent enzyme